MELKQFVEDFNLNTIIRIIQKNEVLYEGKIDILVKLLNCKVLKKSGKLVDGITQIEVREC